MMQYNMTFNINITSASLWFGFILGSLIFFCILYLLSRNKKVSNFYYRIAYLVELYHRVYPAISQDYFNNIVYPKNSILSKFWINNFDYFVVDDYKIKELYNFEEKIENKEIDPKKLKIYSCPWCSNNNKNRFEFIKQHNDQNDNIDVGVLLCLQCGASTPMTTEIECWKLIEE